jgi:hypothetical protein
MPKAFKKVAFAKKNEGEEDKYYRVPIQFDRLSKNQPRARNVTPNSDFSFDST